MPAQDRIVKQMSSPAVFPITYLVLLAGGKKCFLGIKNNINVQSWTCWSYFPPTPITLCHCKSLHVRMESVEQWCCFWWCFFLPLFARHLCFAPVISDWVTEVCLKCALSAPECSMSFCLSDQVVDSDRPEGSKFRLTGKGVDQEPKGTFRINENTGSVSVTRTLDREAIATYQVSTPQVPILHEELWLSMIVCFLLSSLFLGFTRPGLCDFKCVSVGSEWCWTPIGQQWELLSYINGAPSPAWGLGHWKARRRVMGGPQGRSELLV